MLPQSRVIPLLGASALLVAGCSGSPNTPEPDVAPENPGLSGNLRGFFIGNSALNDVVADHVAATAHAVDGGTQITTTESTSSGISLRENADVPAVAAVLAGGAHDYDFVVLTEMWDFQNYDPAAHGIDANAAPAGCPPESYVRPALWDSPPSEWMPNPGFLQEYRDAFVCGNPEARVFYYQTWTLGYNEVIEGAHRASAPEFARPTIPQIADDIAGGLLAPDLPLADRIEYEGVKWERFVEAANRPDIVFLPAAYAIAEFMRDIETGDAPGFEALAASGGLDGTGKLAWADYLFYEDQYHLASIGHYLVSLVIYAGVLDASPLGAAIGTGLYPNSEYFSVGQFPLEEVTDVEFQALLTETGSAGVYDLRGHGGRDYVPTSLRVYLQELAWDVIVANR